MQLSKNPCTMVMFSASLYGHSVHLYQMSCHQSRMLSCDKFSWNTMNTSVGDVENYSLDNFILLTCHHLQIFSFKSVLFFPTLRLGSRCATGTDPLCLHTCCQAGHPLSGLCVPSRQDYHLSCGPRGQQRIPHPPWCRKLWRSLLWYWIRLMATLIHQPRTYLWEKKSYPVC